ncbi:glycosyltransferase family 2 protein [Paenibacillus oralis]|uniref:Glycosyltransferase family 2 protein n=1 Tax=Paenibacillus oralis TaxID=2490856 RepID=A0A3P3TV51_9BACL|nr:glycosyltransferase family 2 protein [Paenibacillus oralis]RRJ61624.1 glycosyltransferase family 2 protein [Paenibacillus oralis]
MSLVTVVVPTYNKAAYIEEALKSIENQTYRDWRLLVVDDGSTDNTVSIVKRVMDPSRTQVIERKQNQGVCHVLNQALQTIQTKYFIQVDGDDWIVPETIEVLLNEMERQSENVALAYANTCHWHEKNGVLHYFKTMKHRPFKDRYDFVVYSSMVQPRFYRTSCVKNVGGWEVDELTGGRMLEDRRMLLRLLDQYNFVHVDRDLYQFRYHHNNLSQFRNAATYNLLIKMFTDKALIRWGDHYRAEMIGPPHLWQTVVLTPTNQRKE